MCKCANENSQYKNDYETFTGIGDQGQLGHIVITH